MDYTESNKLIAEFMGLTPCDTQEQYDTEQDKGNERRIHTSELKYHESWDWLMPVVEEIETTKQVHIVDNLCLVMGVGLPKIKTERPTKLEAVHEAVAAYIQWYNQNK